MLTISRLASYAGVTVAAVRHYHKIGLLPEPERDASGYRSYDAAAVVRLIRIHVLADAGVPLAQVERLLAADADAFAVGVRAVDERLCAEIRRLEDTRRRLAELVGGDRIALPPSVVGYLDRLRELGIAEEYVAMERDAWILVAANMPDDVDAMIADKRACLDDPDMVRMYTLLEGAVTWPADDPRIPELAELIDRIWRGAEESGEIRNYGIDGSFAQLLDATMAAAGPATARLLDLLEARGWKGWTRMRRRPGSGAATG